MKKCLACLGVHEVYRDHCPACGAQVVKKDGVTLYAPELSEGGGGFDPAHFSELVRLEQGNFWFRARNRLILWALQSYCPDFVSFLEIGCGTGYVLSGISATFPLARLSGSEIYFQGLSYAMARQPKVDFMQMDAQAIPFAQEFDVIGAFDVLEHIEKDRLVLEQIHAALKPSGTLVLTVPQHAWLWSPFDDNTFHVRRYAASDLHQKIEAAGFKILRSTSFVSCLLPAMLLSRLFVRVFPQKQGSGLPELEIDPKLNYFFGLLMSCERGFIRMGLSLPLGGSRLVVARKS